MIFFDIDGTLLDHSRAETLAAIAFQNQFSLYSNDSADAFASKWHEVAEKYVSYYLKGKMSFQEQRRCRIRELFGEESNPTDGECDRLFGGYLEKYEEHWSLFPDVLECLEKLGPHELGVISNGDSYQQRRKLEKLGIADHFSKVFISSEVGISKPHAGIFEHACKESGAAPTSCFYIGDNFELDAVGSRKTGMNGVWLNRKKDVRSDAGLMIESLDALENEFLLQNS